MMEKLKLLALAAVLGCLSLGFFACGTCTGDEQVIVLPTDLIKAFEKQERATYSLQPTDSTLGSDTIELIVREEKIVFIDPVTDPDWWFDFGDNSDCVTFVEAYYVRLESNDGKYSLQNYQFAGDNQAHIRGVGFSFMQDGSELLTLLPTSYPLNIVDSTTALIGPENIVFADYRADSGATTVRSKSLTIKRIK